MRARPVLTTTATAVALAGAGALAVRGAGRRIEHRADPGIDPLLSPPEGVTHHHLDTPDGGNLHVVEAGEGPAVVLLHGVTLQWWVWSSMFHLLSDHHRVLAWDMRGHGESRPGSDGVTLEAVGDDLAAVLEALDVREAVVVGHSMGGMALARFSVDHPEVRDERVVHEVHLATSAAPMHPVGSPADSRLSRGLIRSFTLGMESPVRYGWEDNATSRVLVRTVFGRSVSGRAVQDVRTMVAEMAPENLSAAAHAIAHHDTRAALGRVPTPSTVVVGSRDVLTPRRHARVLAESLPQVELRILPGVGHQVMQEAPVELAAIIDEVSVPAPVAAP